jgi:hypothetical protein
LIERLRQMDTGFVAATIKRIARKRIFSSVFFLAAILISITCGLGFLWMIKLTDAICFLSVIVAGLIASGLLIRSTIILSQAIQNPFESFFLSDLQRFGPLQQTIEQIDREAVLYTGKIGSFATQHWIISVQSNSLSFMRIEDIVWIYKQVVENKVRFYYVLTVSTGKTYAAQIWNRSGYCMTIPSTEDGVNGLLETIGKNAPWVTKGYLEILAAAWRSNRADFIASVDQRRRQILGSTEGGNTGSDRYEQTGKNNGTPVVEPLQYSINQPSQYDLNHPVILAGIEAYQKEQDRSIRTRGCVILLLGFGSSIFFILPLVYGIIENIKEMPISTVGIVITIIFLILGIYYSVFGLKGQKFYEKIIGKSLWRLIFFFILLIIGVILLAYGIRFVAGFFGYQVINKFTP